MSIGSKWVGRNIPCIFGSVPQKSAAFLREKCIHCWFFGEPDLYRNCLFILLVQAPKEMLRAVTYHILPIFSSFFQFVQAPKGVSCHKTGACASGGGATIIVRKSLMHRCFPIQSVSAVKSSGRISALFFYTEQTPYQRGPGPQCMSRHRSLCINESTRRRFVI